jgi:GntR family transcriptional regulator, transcriptional repressor for pyruvate dehydrogenase complex
VNASAYRDGSDASLDAWPRSSRISKALRLANHIEQDISEGVLCSGDRLGTKTELRDRFQVAVATVNEAVKLLDSRGLIDARPGPGGGLFVAAPSARHNHGPMMLGFAWAEATMADYHEVRSALEPIIVRHAAHERTPADIASLQSILDRMERDLTDPEKYASDHTALHLRVAKMTPNVPLRSTYVTLVDYFQHSLVDSHLPPTISPKNVQVHGQLVAAIARGDGPWLDKAMQRHDEQRMAGGLWRQ